MATSVQFRPHNRDLGMVMREVDEDLAIFLGMKNGEKERNVVAHIDNFEEFDGSTSAEPKPDSLLISSELGEEAFQSLGDDSLLNLESGKNDHDWLLTQQDADEKDAAANQADASSGECISLNSEQLPKSNSLDSSAAANKRPLSSGGRKPSSSRAATPTRQLALAAKSKPSRASTPTSRAPLKPAAATSSTSSKPMAAQVRTSTPSRVAPRSSTPTSRATAPAASSKPASTSRASTTAARSAPASCSAAPTRKSATASTTSSKSSSGGASSRGKTSSVATKNPVPKRGGGDGGGGCSSRASNPSEMLSVSHDAPQSIKTSMPKRPASASRGRPSAAAAALSSPSKGKPRQKSCSPSKTRGPISNGHKNGSTTLLRSRGYNHGGDDVNPVLMGTKMVERVVNSRKLAPPKQEEHISVENPKKSSHGNSGFGRSLSKKSLDMAIRHMDIRRSVNGAGSLRPVATSVLSYFSNGNQTSSSQSSSFGISESPITSSSDSSKSSNCVNSYFS